MNSQIIVSWLTSISLLTGHPTAGRGRDSNEPQAHDRCPESCEEGGGP